MPPREVSRQSFVRGALGAAAAGVLLGACRPTAVADPPNPTTDPTPPDWGALQDTIDGQVVLPSSSQYTTAKNVFNTRFADSSPAAVVTVTSTGDVQRAVAFAARSGIAITARGGGHSYVGASAADGAMVIDVRQLPGGIAFDSGSGLATVSAAADLASVQTALAAHGRSIPTGSCPSVGVPGLTLGGGLGADARRHGLTCDTLVSASVVLPSGDAVTVAPDDHGDLYWALRGGGANFGVVTSFTFRTFPTTDRDVVSLGFPGPATAQVIHGWHQWLSTADRTVWSMVNITVGPRSGRCGVVLATPPGRGPRLAGDLGAAIGVQPVNNTSRTLNHLDFVDYFSGGAQAVQPRTFVAGSDIIAELTPAAAESIVAATSAWPPEVGTATAVLESLDGAVRDVDPGGSAFPWRRHAACVQWYTEPPTPTIVDAANGWLAAAHDAVRAHSAGGYVNYLEPQTPAQRYFAGNLQRLSAVRKAYDPGSLMYSSLGL
jgi:FAD/FMN-containing dehydrogenase